MNSITAIADLIGRPITPEHKESHDPRNDPIEKQIPIEGLKPHSKYEAEVFNFLHEYTDLLGIKSIRRFTGLLVDGAIDLVNGRRLIVEVKYRMNWEKACQAEWQFRNYIKRDVEKTSSVDGGLVFFEQFSGDWQRHQGDRVLENGWSHWYRGHADVDNRRLDLLRLRARQFENFEVAMRNAKKSSV